MGSIYKRGNTYWIKYYRNGKCHRESSGSTKKMVAKKLLDRREGDIAQGKIPGIQFDKITFEQLAKDFINDYKINDKKSLKRAEWSANHLRRFFGNFSATEITTPKIREYIGMRLGEDVSKATINRELSALKRMLNLGINQTPPIVDRLPKIPMLKENNARKGFFEHWEYLALLETLPEYLKGPTAMGYKIGWRVSEITNLQWSQIDRHLGVVRLDVGETKNDDGRTVYMDSELKEIIRQQWEKREKSNIQLSYVFINRRGDNRIKRFDKAWKKACKEAGIGEKIFHDLRRTAVRNMVRAGIPERVAMMISGHKTRSVFDRYNITSDKDLMEAAQKQESYLNSVMGTNLGTVADFDTKKGLTISD